MASRVLDAAALIAGRLAIEPEAAAWCARKLDAADLIDLTLPDPLHLARLLIGIMGASRPGDAPAIVRAHEGATFAEAWMLEGGGHLRNLPRDELASIPAAAALVGAIDRSAVAFLADLIAIAPGFPRDGEKINAGRLEVSRDLARPMLRLWGNDSLTQTNTVFIWRAATVGRRLGRLQVLAAASGDVIQDLGEIAAGWFTPALAEHQPIGA